MEGTHELPIAAIEHSTKAWPSLPLRTLCYPSSEFAKRESRSSSIALPRSFSALHPIARLCRLLSSWLTSIRRRNPHPARDSTSFRNSTFGRGSSIPKGWPEGEGRFPYIRRPAFPSLRATILSWRRWRQPVRELVDVHHLLQGRPKELDIETPRGERWAQWIQQARVDSWEEA